MIFEKETIEILKRALTKLEHEFKLPEIPEAADLDYEKIESILSETADKLKDNFPYFHPLYAGQMLKPPHPIARAAYMLSMWINPNNHALDGGKASSQMEKEAVSEIAKMFGWDEHLGHLTGGGTMANLEALWISGKLHPNKIIVGSDQAHYTHQRISDVSKLPFKKIKSTNCGQMDINDLENILREEKVGTVVVTIGTTGTGSVDPLYQIIELQKKYKFRIHADAAYGGYFTLADNLQKETSKNYELLSEVDSIVIDPHKHGLQPYGCGCILFKDPSVSKFYYHDSPYTYYSSEEIHLGEISLECSRPGASAVGLWATQKLLPLEKNGEFAKEISKCRDAAKQIVQKINNDDRFKLILEPELDIVVWYIRAKSTQKISDLSRKFFKEAEKNNLFLSLLNIPSSKINLDNVLINSENVTCSRSCLMKPEHLNWVEELWNRIQKTMDEM